MLKLQCFVIAKNGARLEIRIGLHRQIDFTESKLAFNDAITERSLAFTNELDPGYGPFSNQVRGIVRTLLKPGDDLADRFPGLLAELNELLELKMRLGEAAKGPRRVRVHDFLERELAHAMAHAPDPGGQADAAPLDRYLRDAVARFGGNWRQ